MKAIHIVIASALLSLSATATAQSVDAARCIILSNAYGKQAKDAQAQKLAEASLYFYLGRINGPTTTAQLKALFDQQAKTITDANAGTLMGDCVKVLQARVQLLQTLSQESKPPAQPPGR